MRDFKELARRCEQDSGPDRELDKEIWLATFPGSTRKKTLVKSVTGAWPDYTIDETRDENGRLIIVTSFTASIDAAATLGGMLVFASEIGADGLPLVKLVVDTSTSPIIEYTGIGATLPLAWCAAALHAKAAT